LRSITSVWWNCRRPLMLHLQRGGCRRPVAGPATSGSPMLAPVVVPRASRRSGLGEAGRILAYARNVGRRVPLPVFSSIHEPPSANIPATRLAEDRERRTSIIRQVEFRRRTEAIRRGGRLRPRGMSETESAPFVGEVRFSGISGDNQRRSADSIEPERALRWPNLFISRAGPGSGHCRPGSHPTEETAGSL